MSLSIVLAAVLAEYSRLSSPGPAPVLSSDVLPGRTVVLLPSFHDGMMLWRESYILPCAGRFYVLNRNLRSGGNREFFRDLPSAARFLFLA